MPLEVRQIGIRMAVGDAGGEPASGDGSSASDVSNDQDDGDEDRALLIEQCVAAVLDELARRADR